MKRDRQDTLARYDAFLRETAAFYQSVLQQLAKRFKRTSSLHRGQPGMHAESFWTYHVLPLFSILDAPARAVGDLSQYALLCHQLYVSLGDVGLHDRLAH